MTDETFLAAMKAKFPRHVKVGKVTGQVRLYGAAWDAVRSFVFGRDGGKCVDCKREVLLKKGDWLSMHCAHIKSKGSGGNDLPSNLVTKCLECHGAEHNGSGKNQDQEERAGYHR